MSSPETQPNAHTDDGSLMTQSSEHTHKHRLRGRGSQVGLNSWVCFGVQGRDRSSLPVYRGEELISASAALQSSQITSISQVCVCLNRVVVLEPHPVKILQLTLWCALRDTCSQFLFLKILHSYLRSLYRYLSAFMSKFIISNGLINEGRLSKWQTLQLDFQSEPTVSVVIEKSEVHENDWNESSRMSLRKCVESLACLPQFQSRSNLFFT